MRFDPAGLVYGTITVASLLAAETARSETYGETVAAVVLALLLFWLAHAYSDFAGERLAAGEPLRLGGLGRMMMRQVTMLTAAAVPLLTVLAGWLTGATLDDAITAAVWSAAVVIVAIELISALRAHARPADIARQTAYGAVMGLLVVALKVVLH